MSSKGKQSSLINPLGLQRGDAGRQRALEARVHALGHVLKAIQPFDQTDRLMICVYAIGETIAETPREAKAVTALIEKLIGQGAVNPANPGLLEKIARECTRKRRAPRPAILTGEG
jgi:hypothetical protein